MVKKIKSTESKVESKKCCPDNVWMYVSVGLGIAFIIALVLAITGATKTTMQDIGLTPAKTIVLDLLNTMAPGTDANVTASSEVSSFYKLTLSVQGQEQEIYISKDGKYLANLLINVAELKQQLEAANDTNTPANADVNSPTAYALPTTINEAPKQGNLDSKIIVMEASDFQCPYCGLTAGSPWSESLKSSQYAPMIGTTLKIEEMAKAGKILFRQFPVAINTSGGSTESIDASNAAFCAEDQNKYWEMHDLLFAAQDSQNEYTGKFAKDKLKIMGAKIEGLDLTKFNECVDKDTYVGKVESMTQDVATASYANTNSFGTPMYYIIVDASLGKAKIESLAKAANYTVAPTSDGSKYVIIADPEYATITKVIEGLTA